MGSRDLASEGSRQKNSEGEQSLRLHVESRDPHFNAAEYESFKRKQIVTYQNLHAAGFGNRFGAFVDGRLVADLGLYRRASMARLQNVVTPPQFRRQGFCGQLVYESSQFALEHWNVQSLVMEADPDYHAAQIYQTVGFKLVE